MTITLESFTGFLAALAFSALIECIGVLIHAEKLLGRCRDVLGFAFFMAARQDEWDSLLDGDDNNHEALIYNEGYKRATQMVSTRA